MLDKWIHKEICKKLNRVRLGESTYLYSYIKMIIFRMHKYEETLQHIIDHITSDKDEQDLLENIVKGCLSCWKSLTDTERSGYESLLEYSFEYIAMMQLANQEHFNEPMDKKGM